MDKHNCKVCGEPVEFSDSAYALSAVVEHRVTDPGALLSFWRGLRGDKHIRCSPSRAQYIMDENFPQVVDTRPESSAANLDPQMLANAVAIYTLCWRELQFLGALKHINYDFARIGADVEHAKWN